MKLFGLGTKTSARKMETAELCMICLPAVIVVFIWCYLPMIGIIIPFKDFKYDLGVFGSEWCGLKNFEFFFKSDTAFVIVRNTLVLNALFIITGTVVNIIFAILLYQITSTKMVKLYQTVSMLPRFLTWIIASYMLYIFLDPQKGVLNEVLGFFGKDGIDWYTNPKYWPVILVLSNIWKTVGNGMIIYYAALMGIDNQMFEAADLDGATSFQKAWYISIPTIMPIIITMTILSIGNIFRSDFSMFYQLTRNVPLLYSTTDVVDTYVYRALRQDGNISMSAAVGLIQSVVGFTLTIVTNYAVKKIDPDQAMF